MKTIFMLSFFVRKKFFGDKSLWQKKKKKKMVKKIVGERKLLVKQIFW